MGQHAEQIQIAGYGGNQTALNITAAAVVKAALGTLFRVIISNPGSSGSLVINDCATIGAATASNVLCSITAAQLLALQSSTGSVPLKFSCKSGITISSVPTGGTFAVTFS